MTKPSEIDSLPKTDGWKTFLVFVVKETKHILRDRRTMLILFGMPIMLMMLFGFAIRNDVRNVRTLVVTSSIDGATQRIVEALDASEYFTVVGTAPSGREAERMIHNQQADLAIVFSPRYADNKYRDARVEILTDAADPNMGQQYAVYAQSIIGSAIAAQLNGGYTAAAPSAVSTQMLFNPRLLSAYNFVPGIMGMLLLLICAMMTSVSIAREKEKGTMEVLLVSPIQPLVIIIAKAVPYMVLSIIILITILLMSYYVLLVPLAGSLLWIVVVSLIYILLSLSLGLLVSNVANSQLVALLMSAMVMLMPVIMLSGLIFPVESMPQILQWLSCIVPARWYISAMRKLMIMGVGYAYVLKEMAILCGMTVLILTISLVKFKTRLE